MLSKKRMGKMQVAGQVQTARDPKTWFASQLHTASDKMSHSPGLSLPICETG